MDKIIPAIILVAIIGLAALFFKWKEKKMVADAKRRSSPEYKKQEEERKKQEEERKHQEKLAQCQREGHRFLPLTGEEFGYKKEFLQMDHRGYQREHCWRCGMIRVTDERLAEIDAPEFQSEYGDDMYWLVNGEQINIGHYSIEIDTEKSAYLYLSQNISDGLRRGDVYACMQIKGDRLFSEEHIEKNEEYPVDRELERFMAAEDENGETITGSPIKCLGKEYYESLGVYQRQELLKDLESGAKEYPRNNIFIQYEEKVKKFRPLAVVKD